MTDDAPIGGRNFNVHVTRLGPRGGVRDEFELACRRVELPVMRVVKRRFPLLGRPPVRPPIDAADRADGADDSPDDPAGTEAAREELLVLRRGHTGSTELYDWWSTERSAVFRGSHDVEVIALAADSRAVTTWGFTGCRLVALRYSPLDAVDSDVLIETAEISFETVTQIAHG